MNQPSLSEIEQDERARLLREANKQVQALEHYQKLSDQKDGLLADLRAQLAPGPCGKHPMWAWRTEEGEWISDPRSPDGKSLTEGGEAHCILCEEVRAAEVEALERACRAMCPLCIGVEGFSRDAVVVTDYCQPETWWHALTNGRKGHDLCKASPIRTLTSASGGAQATSVGDMGDREPQTDAQALDGVTRKPDPHTNVPWLICRLDHPFQRRSLVMR